MKRVLMVIGGVVGLGLMIAGSALRAEEVMASSTSVEAVQDDAATCQSDPSSTHEAETAALPGLSAAHDPVLMTGSCSVTCPGSSRPFSIPPYTASCPSGTSSCIPYRNPGGAICGILCDGIGTECLPFGCGPGAYPDP